MVLEEIDKEANNIQTRLLVKTMRQDCTEFASSIQLMKNFQRKNARRKLEVLMPAAMPCKVWDPKWLGETRNALGSCKSKYACIVEVDKSTRKRMGGSLHKDHEDYIAGKAINSLNHYNLVHKFMCVKRWKYQTQKQQWTKNGKNLRKYSHDSRGKSEIRKKWSMKQGKRAWKFIVRRSWTCVILRIRSWNLNFKIVKVELCAKVT